jgi:hypothetical protein
VGWRLGGMLAESLRDYRPDRPRASESEVLGAKLRPTFSKSERGTHAEPGRLPCGENGEV